jgi:23S rRNA (uracil1939-C5)-methyltransferase
MSREPHSRKPPQEHECRIAELTSDGLGVAEVNERPARVRNALPGETVRARIVRKRRGIRYADAVAVDDVSVDRVAPACPYFPRCGGCAMHHLAPAAQLALKERSVRDVLEHSGVVPSRWHAPVSLVRLGYRRKARLGVRLVGSRVLVGFRESFSNRVARMEACAVLTPRLSALIPGLKKTIAAMSCAHQVPQVELAEGDFAASIIVRHLVPLTAHDVDLWRRFSDRHNVQALMQPGGYDTLHCVHGEAVRDLSYLVPEYGLAMDFHPAQFTQVNAPMNRELIRTALGYFGPLSGSDVADLFCGIGNFALPLARSGARVRGFELAADAVDKATSNATKNGLVEACRFASLDLYSAAGEIALDVDAMLVDPPRSGAGPNLASWVANPRLRRLVYVSCGPKSFAQDAEVLLNCGFALADVGIFDMFPHTAHVETIGHFIRG